MPHNIEAEQAVLGCNLIDTDIAVDIMAKLKTEDFYTQAHQTIFDAMLNIYKKNSPIDFVTITDELEKQGAMDSVGGIDYIATLTNIVPSAANYNHYVEIVKRDSLLRKLIKASEEVIKEAYEGENKENTLNFAEKKIFDISQNEDSSSLVSISGPVASVIDKLDEIAKNKGEISGIPTGFKSFDKLTNGLHEGELIIIAARPGVGKTSFAMNIVNHASVECGKVCAVFSLEMPKEQLAQRSMFSISGVDMAKGLKGSLNKDEYKAIWAAGKKLSDSKLYVDDTSTRSQNWRLANGSTPVVGSSSTSRSGSWINAQHSPSFCFMPPESLPAGRSRKLYKPVLRVRWSIRRRRSSALWPKSLPKNCKFSSTVKVK